MQGSIAEAGISVGLAIAGAHSIEWAVTCSEASRRAAVSVLTPEWRGQMVWRPKRRPGAPGRPDVQSSSDQPHSCRKLPRLRLFVAELEGFQLLRYPDRSLVDISPPFRSVGEQNIIDYRPVIEIRSSRVFLF